MNRISGTIVLLALLFTGLASGQDIPLLDKAGKPIQGKLLEDHGEYITVTGSDGGTEKIIYLDLHPRTVVALRAKRTPEDNGAEQFRLGEYAMMYDLFDEARKHFHLARKADPSLGERVERELKRADREEPKYLLRCATVARHEKHEGELAANVSHLVHRFPDSPEAAEAEKMLGYVHAHHKAENALSQMGSGTRKLIANEEKHYRMAVKDQEQALRLFRKMTQSIHLYERALGHLKRCEMDVRRLRQEQKQNADFQSEVEGFQQGIKSLAIQIYINVSNIYLGRGSYVQAQRWAHKGFLVDEKNPKILSQLNRIRMFEAMGGRGRR
jgi:tetratricopeptide (TPR) repeat protein